MMGEDPRLPLAGAARGLMLEPPPSSLPKARSQELPVASVVFTTVLPGLHGISSTSKTLSVRTDVFVVLWEPRERSYGSLGDDSMSRYDAGMRGTSGTDDLRLIALALGGLGNIRVTFSSKVMLLVSFGCGLDGRAALFGREGRGGSCVGLPAVEARSDFLPIKEPPDLLRL